MKKIFFLSFFAAVFAPLAPSVSAQTFTLIDYENNVNWSSPDIWSIDGETSQTYPQDGGTVVFRNENQTSQNIITISGQYKIDSLDISMKGSAHYRLHTAGSSLLEIAGDSAINSAFNWMQFIVAGTGSYDFKGNLAVKSDIGGGLKSIIAFGEATTSQLQSFRVGGNLGIQKNTSGAMSVYFNAKEVLIGGNMNIADGAVVVLARSTRGAESSFSVGGITGGGSIVLGFDSASYYAQKSVAGITIANGGSWAGSFQKLTTNADSRFNVTMDGGGTQDFRVSSATFADGAANSNIIDTLTVNRGAFNYGAGGYASGSLVLNGGKFGAAAAADPGTTSADVGTARFESGLWNGGAIVLDISAADAAYDKIEFSGVFDRGGGDASLEFRFDADGMKELIDMGFSTFEDMIVYASGSSVAGTVLSGVTDGIQWEAVFGETGMTATFAVVPEPAALAALSGLAALLFAAALRVRGGKE